MKAFVQQPCLPDLLEGNHPASSSPAGRRQREKHFARREKVQGQFLTPPEVARFIVGLVTLHTTRRNLAIDPACGDGVFLQPLLDAKFEQTVGIDVDAEVLRHLPGGLRDQATVLCGDGLEPLSLTDGRADAVVGNPPYSAKYGRVTASGTLSRFDLGRGRKSQAIELLFVERFLQLAGPKGVIGVILPQGVFSALPLRFVRQFILDRATILAVVSLPRGIFTNGTSSKTCVLFLQRGVRQRMAFMGIADRVDDLPTLLEAYRNHKERHSPRCFWVSPVADSLDPEFCSLSRSAFSFKADLPVLPLCELVSSMRCGATEYGEKRKFFGDGLRFISAKNVTSLGLDFRRREKYVQPNSPMDKPRAHVAPSDVLFVRVGVGCSGRASLVVDQSEVGVADDWIYILKPKVVSPGYLTLFFYSRPGKTQIERLKRGVGTVNIPRQLLGQILVPVPPRSFQEEIERAYRQMVMLRRAGRVDEAAEEFGRALHEIETLTTDQSNEGEESV